MSSVRLFRASLLPLVLAGCAADSASQPEYVPPPQAVDEINQSVIGGTSAMPCQWPSTVRVESGGYCTGTLIHSRVVTTAAHCLEGTSANISFGEMGAPGTFTVKARCVGGAKGSAGANTNKDWGYCVLPEDPRIAAIPVTPPLVGCEAKLVTAGSKAWVVGYGATSARGNVTSKRQVEVVVNALDKIAPGTLDVGDRNVGACHGDSGGPLYVHLSKDGHDYGVRVAGSTSGAGPALFCDCTCSTTYIAIENHVKAIEANEKIDVTPCTNADGAWDPGPNCRDLMSAPESGTGTYPAACNVQRTSAPIESCGPNTQTGGGDAGAGDGGAHTGAADGGSAADAGRTDGGAAGDAGSKAATDAGASRTDAAAAATGARDAGKRDAGSKTDSADDESEDENDDESASENDDDSNGKSSGKSPDKGYTSSGSSCAATGAGRMQPGELLALCLGGLALFARRWRLRGRALGTSRRA